MPKDLYFLIPVSAAITVGFGFWFGVQISPYIYWALKFMGVYP